MTQAKKDKVKRCENCKHCIWFNRWRCDLGCWEFELWLPRDCKNYEE